MLKKPCDDVNSVYVYYENLDNYDDDDDFSDADNDKFRKIGSIRTLFKKFNRDYYKPIKTDEGFAGIINNYIEYVSKGERYENLSPEEYLNMIRPYLRDLINEHMPPTEFNNNNNNNNNRAEWKIQVTMIK